MVFNKIDAFEPESLNEDEEKSEKHNTLDEWESTWMNKMNGQALFISALNKDNLDTFRTRVYSEVRKFTYKDFL